MPDTITMISQQPADEKDNRKKVRCLGFYRKNFQKKFKIFFWNIGHKSSLAFKMEKSSKCEFY